MILLISKKKNFGDLLVANGCEGRGFLFGLTRLVMSIDVFIIITIVLFVWNICDISVTL